MEIINKFHGVTNFIDHSQFIHLKNGMPSTTDTMEYGSVVMLITAHVDHIHGSEMGGLLHHHDYILTVGV